MRASALPNRSLTLRSAPRVEDHESSPSASRWPRLSDPEATRNGWIRQRTAPCAQDRASLGASRRSGSLKGVNGYPELYRLTPLGAAIATGLRVPGMSAQGVRRARWSHRARSRSRFSWSVIRLRRINRLRRRMGAQTCLQADQRTPNVYIRSGAATRTTGVPGLQSGVLGGAPPSEDMGLDGWSSPLASAALRAGAGFPEFTASPQPPRTRHAKTDGDVKSSGRA